MAGQTFLEQGSTSTDYRKSRFVVLPVPYEDTTTYGKGTKNGPAAIIAASKALEGFDEELLVDVARKEGIYTSEPCNVEGLKCNVEKVLEKEKVPDFSKEKNSSNNGSGRLIF